VKNGSGAGAESAVSSEGADRILEAAAAGVIAHGAAGLTMHEVADAAGVSKALIHYHYTDKDALLERVARYLGERIAARSRHALTDSTAASAVDDLWRWLEVELERGEWRAMLELQAHANEAVHAAARRELRALASRTERTMTRLTALLGVRLRVAPAILGGLFVTLIEGLAVAADADESPEPRDVLDAFILALLGLST
jgi:AcrR family transcriptional regulator